MRVVIIGRRLPGRAFRDTDGRPLDNVHVGVQVGRDPSGLVPGDASAARWVLDVRVHRDAAGDLDFKGTAVQGKRGERFLYLTWGNVSPGSFAMFRRAKLMLNRIDVEVVDAADVTGHHLLGVVQLTDERGGPRCARVDSPALVWSSEPD